MHSEILLCLSLHSASTLAVLPNFIVWCPSSPCQQTPEAHSAASQACSGHVDVQKQDMEVCERLEGRMGAVPWGGGGGGACRVEANHDLRDRAFLSRGVSCCIRAIRPTASILTTAAIGLVSAAADA